MADPNYYYNKGGTPTGPITVVQLKELCTTGQIKPTDLVWREGTPNWVPAQSVKGLFGTPSPASTSPPPPPPPSSGPPPISAAPPPGSSRAGWSPQSEDAKAAAEYARQAASAAREASQQAWVAVKTLVADPVGGIGQSFESLGSKGALAVGAVFCVVYLLCPILGSIIGGSGSFGMGAVPYGGGDGWFKHAVVGLIVDAAVIATMVGVSYLYRLKTKSGGMGVAADLLIVGTALLPIGIARLATAPLNMGNLIWIAIYIFAVCFCVLLLFSGLVKITKLSERVATVAVPLMLVAAACVAHLLGRVL